MLTHNKPSLSLYIYYIVLILQYPYSMLQQVNYFVTCVLSGYSMSFIFDTT